MQYIVHPYDTNTTLIVNESGKDIHSSTTLTIPQRLWSLNEMVGPSTESFYSNSTKQLKDVFFYASIICIGHNTILEPVIALIEIIALTTLLSESAFHCVSFEQEFHPHHSLSTIFHRELKEAFYKDRKCTNDRPLRLCMQSLDDLYDSAEVIHNIACACISIGLAATILIGTGSLISMPDFKYHHYFENSQNLINIIKNIGYVTLAANALFAAMISECFTYMHNRFNTWEGSYHHNYIHLTTHFTRKARSDFSRLHPPPSTEETDFGA